MTHLTSDTMLYVDPCKSYKKKIQQKLWQLFQTQHCVHAITIGMHDFMK